MLDPEHTLSKYNDEFPETFAGYGPYHAQQIAEAIRRDLKTPDRNLTPGLREALRIIARREGHTT